jgi:methionine synthase II (cobalamin-independent)
MLTTVIGAYPKPEYLKITDWFNTQGGTDTANTTKLYTEEVNQMCDNAEDLFVKAAGEVI